MMARSTLNRRDRGRAASMKLQAKMAEGHWTPLAARQAGCPVAHVPPCTTETCTPSGYRRWPTGRRVADRCTVPNRPEHRLHPLPERVRRCSWRTSVDLRPPAAGQHEKPKRGHSGSRRAAARLDFLLHLAELREHLGGQEPFTLALGVLDHRAAGIASLRYQTPASRHPDNFPDHNPLQTLMVRCRPTPKA